MDLMFLDETPFIGNYVYPHPSTAYFNPYLASQVGFLSCEEDENPRFFGCIALLDGDCRLSLLPFKMRPCHPTALD